MAESTTTAGRPAYAHAAAKPAPHSLTPARGGWHCSHLYYSFDRTALKQLSDSERSAGIRLFDSALAATGPEAPLRLQTSIVAGQKADFGVMMLDPDPLKIDRVHQRLLSTPLGPALRPTYSFISMTEVSEYVQSAEQFSQRLAAEGLDPASPEHAARLKAYTTRLDSMNRQRLTPDLPPYPVMCFYPMNKIRDPRANWYLLPKAERSRLMIDHAKSGMAYAGKVSQLITVGIGLDDWEWGVTLWAANPEFLKDIVYRMRFDEASARYAEFGPFTTSCITTPGEILAHCQVA